MKNLLVCGATGFIGRNALERFRRRGGWKLHAIHHKTRPPRELASGRGIRWVRADLRDPAQVLRAVKGMDAVFQAAATTSGSRDIVGRPHHHVTDNAVMNSLLFRACHDHKVGRVVFLSCSVMYPSSKRPVRESDFTHAIIPTYFGVGWTKVYLEKMCEFYARLGPTRYTVIRHSNIYGPHDKYDLERSHVFGATVAKVMTAQGGEIVVWGDGSEKRDLLYIDDLLDFVEAALDRQKAPFDLVNVGSGRAVSVAELASKIIELSGRDLRLRFDRTKPTIPFSLALDAARARKLYGWRPATTLEGGIRLCLDWYLRNKA